MATAEAIDGVKPQMGVSVSEGTITKWLKQEGGQVEADESLLEISTDKVDTEVPSPASGTLTQILVQEGETVPVGTKVGQIGGSAAGDGAAPSAPPPQEAPSEPATQQAADAARAAAPGGVGQGAPEGEGLEPMTAMRRGIAEHMRRSLDTSAHVTTVFEVDMSKVVAVRRKLKPEYEKSYGVNPTYLAFIARATVETIKNWPWVNGEIRGDKIVTKSFVNLGIAVALEGGKGLI